MEEPQAWLWKLKNLTELVLEPSSCFPVLQHLHRPHPFAALHPQDQEEGVARGTSTQPSLLAAPITDVPVVPGGLLSPPQCPQGAVPGVGRAAVR